VKRLTNPRLSTNFGKFATYQHTFRTATTNHIVTCTLAARLSADAACSVLATDVFEWFSVASGRLGVELDFRLVSTLVPPFFVESAMFLLPLPETQHKFK
jgi:hypothetical protein